MRLIDMDALIKDQLDKYDKHPSDRAWDRYIDIRNAIQSAPVVALSPVWTPCSEGLPEGEGEFDVTVFIIENGERRYVSTTATYDPMDDEDEWCQVQHPGGVVVAWKELSEPYNPNQFRDTTKKVIEQP